MVTVKRALRDLSTSVLVEFDENGDVSAADSICTTSGELMILLKELQRYRDLEQQGLLLRLPCKVGDTIYTISRNTRIIELKIQEISLFWLDGGVCTQLKCSSEDKMGYGNYHFLSSDIGEIVFLSKAEAEQSLEKISDNIDERNPYGNYEE